MAVSTAPRGATERTGQTTEIDFYFDPGCPWAWRTSLWIREVAKVRPVTIHWKFLRLESINTTRGGEVKQGHIQARDSFKLMALARREQGDEAVDRLYLALGQAKHDRKENLAERDVLLRAIAEAGLEASLLDRALADDSLAAELEQEEATIEQAGGFGVPTIVLEGRDPLFGPVVNPPATGEEAGEMWDHFVYFLQRPDFFELKREIRR
jgi:predicted DsbA family dithiol-disulfide isomerase